MIKFVSKALSFILRYVYKAGDFKGKIVHMSYKNKFIFDSIILSSISIYVFAEFLENITAVKNIGISLATITLLLYGLFFKNDIITNFKNNYTRNKYLFWLVILAISTMFLFSVFPYDSTYNSIYSAFKDNKRSFMLFIICFLWFDGKQLKSKVVFYALVLSFIFCSIYFSIDIFKSNLSHFMSMDSAVIDRNYAKHFDMLFVFCFVAFIVFNNKILKPILLFFFDIWNNA